LEDALYYPKDLGRELGNVRGTNSHFRLSNSYDEMKKEITLEEITKFLEDVWTSTPRTTSILHTGRQGAILQECVLLEMLHPERDKADIRREVEAKDWPHGMYEIGGEPYIKFLGWKSRPENNDSRSHTTLDTYRLGLFRLPNWQDST
jgi:hypothetical protein